MHPKVGVGYNAQVAVDARYKLIVEQNVTNSGSDLGFLAQTPGAAREVLGVDIGPSEDTPWWRAVLQGLVARGLRGVRLAISDAHRGLKQAIREVFVGAAWQRCRVHFMRNIVATVPKSAQAMVAATVRTIFEEPDRAAARA